jgi:hypothetical protein
MLSVGWSTPHFSPSQDIRGIKSAHRMVMYITDKFPYTELELGFAGRVATDVASSRIAFLCGG